MALKARMVGREALMRKLAEVAPAAEAAAAAAQAASAKELAEAIRSRAPRVTGRYADSIQAAPVAGRNDIAKPIGIQATKDANAWGIFASYVWRFLEFGTRSHRIRARNRRSLAFDVAGGKAFPKRVQHPGMAARPHIFPTYRGMRKRIRRRVASAINKAIKKAAGS